MSKKPGDWWNESLNLIEGCTPISEACEHCWALQMMKRFRGQPPGEFRHYPQRLTRVYYWKKPRRVFVGSMTDLFHDELQRNCLSRQEANVVLVPVPVLHPHHTFIVLTKRPQNAISVSRSYHRDSFPRNLWFLVTVENQRRLNERLPALVEVQCDVKGLHMEPLLGPVDITPALPYVQWVVVGGENGPGARPMHPDWVRDIRDKCVEAGVKFWFKGWGRWIPLNDLNHKADGPLRLGKKNIWMQAPSKIWREGTQRTLDGREWNELPTQEV